MPVKQLQGSTNKIFSYVGTSVLRLNDTGFLIVSFNISEGDRKREREVSNQLASGQVKITAE